MSALTYATAQLLRVVPRAQVGQALGRLADLRWPSGVGKAVVGLYSRVYDVELGECESPAWGSFDAFFTRGLRKGARPVDTDPRAIASVADGHIGAMGPIDASSTWPVKGRPYRVGELLGSEEEGRRFEGGRACVIYLSPRDYHRVHAPVRGTIRSVVSLPGDYYPVNAIGMQHVPNLFVRNRRVVIAIDTGGATSTWPGDTAPGARLGRVTIVMVSAMIVGRITVTGIEARDVPLGTHRLDLPIDKGEEIGVFHLGSTAVVLVERAARAEWTLPPGPVRFGERIAMTSAGTAGKDASPTPLRGSP
jgi:phosphatidylserine decarboxylase